MPARNSRGRSPRTWSVRKTGEQTADVAAGGQRQCLMTLPLPRVSGLESGSAMIMDTERLGWERRQGGRLHSRVALWMVRSSGPGYCSQVAGWRSAISRPQGWSSFRNSRLLHVGVDGTGRKTPLCRHWRQSWHLRLVRGGGKGIVIPCTTGEEGPGMGKRECRSFVDRVTAKALARNQPGVQPNPLCSGRGRKSTWQHIATSAPARARSRADLA